MTVEKIQNIQPIETSVPATKTKEISHDNKVSDDKELSNAAKYAIGATAVAGIIALGIIGHKNNWWRNTKKLTDSSAPSTQSTTVAPQTEQILTEVPPKPPKKTPKKVLSPEERHQAKISKLKSKEARAARRISQHYSAVQKDFEEIATTKYLETLRQNGQKYVLEGDSLIVYSKTNPEQVEKVVHYDLAHAISSYTRLAENIKSHTLVRENNKLLLYTKDTPPTLIREIPTDRISEEIINWNTLEDQYITIGKVSRVEYYTPNGRLQCYASRDELTANSTLTTKPILTYLTPEGKISKQIFPRSWRASTPYLSTVYAGNEAKPIRKILTQTLNGDTRSVLYPQKNGVLGLYNEGNFGSLELELNTLEKLSDEQIKIARESMYLRSNNNYEIIIPRGVYADGRDMYWEILDAKTFTPKYQIKKNNGRFILIEKYDENKQRLLRIVQNPDDESIIVVIKDGKKEFIPYEKFDFSEFDRAITDTVSKTTV